MADRKMSSTEGSYMHNQLTRRVTMAAVMTAAAFLMPRPGTAATGACCFAALAAAQARCIGLTEEDFFCWDESMWYCSYTAHCYETIPFWGGCVWDGWDFVCC